MKESPYQQEIEDAPLALTILAAALFVMWHLLY